MAALSPQLSGRGACAGRAVLYLEQPQELRAAPYPADRAWAPRWVGHHVGQGIVLSWFWRLQPAHRVLSLRVEARQRVRPDRWARVVRAPKREHAVECQPGAHRVL